MEGESALPFLRGEASQVHADDYVTTLSHNGRAYVRRHYRWDVIMDKYERMLSRVRRKR